MDNFAIKSEKAVELIQEINKNKITEKFLEKCLEESHFFIKMVMI